MPKTHESVDPAHAHAIAMRLCYRRPRIWTLTPVWMEHHYRWLILNETSTLDELKQKIRFLARAPDRSRTYTQTFIVEKAGKILLS